MQSQLNHPGDDLWPRIAPLLDEAVADLSDIDRQAILLRFYEGKSLREIGTALDASDDAAQKRVTRAVERLREFFAQRGVTVGANGLAVVLSANAVQAAPVGLAVTISTAAALAGTTLVTSATATAAKTIAMTTLQKTLVGTALVAALGVAVFQTREAARLREANREQAQQQVALAQEIERLKGVSAAASERVAALANQATTPRTNPSEVLKLRGQVGVLRQEKADLGRKSGLSKVTADPVARKAMRDAQKLGMKSIYEELTKRLALSPELQEQFHDLLADDIMQSVDLITQSLQDKSSAAEIDRLFSAQEAALRDKVAAVLGPDGVAQFRDYSKDVVSTLTAMEFEAKLTGEKEAKAEKKGQLLLAMREETATVLAAAGMPADYQPLPMLNFRNIASEETAEQSLGLMASVFERVATRANTFLSPDEVKQFQNFGKKALENNRTMLLMNRKMMAPIAE